MCIYVRFCLDEGHILTTEEGFVQKSHPFVQKGRCQDNFYKKYIYLCLWIASGLKKRIFIHDRNKLIWNIY